MTDTLKTVQALVEALSTVRQLCAETQALQGREYVSLGIQVNNALDAGRALIEQMQRAAVQPVAWLRDEWNGTGMRSVQLKAPPQELPLREQAIGVIYTPLYAAPQPAQASDRGEQIQPVHSTPCVESASMTPLPCPFCGTEPRILKRWDESHYSHDTVEFMRIVCDECSAESMDSEDHDEVLAAWNRRSAAIPDAAQRAAQDHAYAEGRKDECEAWEARLAQQQDDPAGSPAPSPVAWTLTETLTRKETTTRAYLWFTDPVNCLWTPLYSHPTPSAQSSKAALSDEIRTALELAVRQNEHDMLMTGEELRHCRAILARAGITQERDHD